MANEEPMYEGWPSGPRRLRPVVFAKQQDLEDLSAIVAGLQQVGADMAARQSIFERALDAVIQDLEDLFSALQGEPEDDIAATIAELDQYEPDADDEPGYQPVGGMDKGDPERDETPEEEAARLRREAIAEYVQGNESEPAGDFNDVTDVPEEGRSV